MLFDLSWMPLRHCRERLQTSTARGERGEGKEERVSVLSSSYVRMLLVETVSESPLGLMWRNRLWPWRSEKRGELHTRRRRRRRRRRREAEKMLRTYFQMGR